MGNVEAKQCESSKSKTGCCPIIPFKGSMTNLRRVGRGSSETADAICCQIENEKPHQFSCKELRKYTSRFSHRLGSGGFGYVYKGQLPSGVPIAVKVLKDPKRKDATKTSFIAEVSTIGKTYHRNLVKLHGFCYDADMIALVYEFVENGSLDNILYRNHLNLKFEELFDIATGTAKGISYLHEECPSLIIHYDIKPENVLIDSSFCPKVADFGLAKLCNVDSSHITLDGVRGTPGYIAPELRSNSPIQVNCKCDVYSFGIMLFEILRRKRNHFYNTGEKKWFPDRVWRKFKEGRLDAVLKECGFEDKNRDKAKRLFVVALLCTQYKPKDRPSMSKVVKILEGETGYEGEKKTILSSNKAPSGIPLTVSASTCAKSSSPAEISSTSDGNFTAGRSTSDERRVHSRSTLQKSTVEVKKPCEENKYIKIDNAKKKKEVHGESCARKVQNYIKDTEGVHKVDVDFDNLHVTVGDDIDEEGFVEYVRKTLEVNMETTGEENITTKSSVGRAKSDKRRDDQNANRLSLEGGRATGKTDTELKLKLKNKLENRGKIRATKRNVVSDETREENAIAEAEKKNELRMLEKTESRKRKEEKQEETGTVNTKEGNEDDNVLAKIETAESKHREKTKEGVHVNEDIFIKRTVKNEGTEKLKGTDTESDKGNQGKCEGNGKIYCQSFHGNGVFNEASYGFTTRMFDDENPNACSIQ